MRFEGKKLEFPVSYSLRVVMNSKESQANENLTIIKKILTGLEIDHSNWGEKPSSGNSYIRYSVDVTLESKEKMDMLYKLLNSEEAVKFAI